MKTGTAEVINVGRHDGPGHLTWYWTARAHGGARHGLAASEHLAWREARAAVDELRRTHAVART